MKQKLLMVLVISILIAFSTGPLSGQVVVDVKGKINDEANSRANQHADEGIDKGFDAAENGVKNAFKKKDKKENNETESSEEDTDNPSVKKSGKQPDSSGESNEKSAVKQDTELASYSKFDFIPGEDVLFFDDFSQDNVGDFPALWNTNGSGEVVTTNLFPGKWFKTTGTGYYFPETSKAFPENFTAEFDLIPQSNNQEYDWVSVGFYLCDCNFKDPSEGGAIPGKAGIKMFFDQTQCSYSAYADGSYTIEGHNENVIIEKNKKCRVSLWVQKQRVRLYINEKKAFDAPRALATGYQYNMLRFQQDADYPAMVSNFRIAAGLPDMRSKLITEGKLVTHGIYFDVNSDKVKPESYGTLKSIAQVLTENPDVKVKIVGHTDSDGDAAKNLDLSKKRSASVKNELVKNFGIDAARIETDGKGKTEPMAPNDTPSNKALNRRVEFIKL